jgi:hypothetical protein
MSPAASRPIPGVLRIATSGLALVLACQSGPPAKAPAGGRESQFPSPAELSQLPPAPATLNMPEVDDVEVWTLAGPFPERVEMAPHEPATAYERVLAEAVADRAGLAVASESMHCTAREIGRFLLARNKPPPNALMEFTAARCGAVGAEFRPAWYLGDVPSGISDEALLAKWRPEFEPMVRDLLGGGAVASGLWFGRESGRAVVAIVTMQRRAIVTPFSPVVAEGRIAFSGELLLNAEQLVAHVNQGALGYAECEFDPNLRLPRFAASCPVSPGDAMTVIEVSLREPGRILAQTALRVLVRREDEPGLTWQRLNWGASQPTATSAEFAESLSAAVARVRSGAELRPLGLSVEQSEAANELVPHVIAGSMGMGSPALADLAALGLFAGWEVGGPIKDATLASAMITGGLDAGRWLETALGRPSGRAALLDPQASVLAVGAFAPEGSRVTAAIAVTYRLFGDEDFEADADRVFERVAAARAAKGRSAPTPLSAAQPAVTRVTGSLPSGRLDPRAALEDALARAVAATSQPLRGWVLEASSLDELRLPDELSDWESVQVAVGVGYFQPEDDAWGHYVALIVAAAPGLDI